MQARTQRLLRWRAAGIVAAALLSSCERKSDPNEVHTYVNALTTYPRASDVYVGIDNGTVTVRAHDAPLHAVIEELAEHGGLLVLTKDRLDQRVTAELHSMTLRSALQELLRGRNFVLVDARQDGRARLWILSEELNPGGADVSVGFSEDSRESAREELKTLDEIGAALTDLDSNARIDAVSDLGNHVDDEQATMQLASVASQDEDPSVRAEALHAIGGARAETHAPVFIRALTDRDAGVRKAAISALENIGGEYALQTLAIALKDREPSVRASAVDAIGEIGGVAARPLLESALADENAVVREAATERLVSSTDTAEELFSQGSIELESSGVYTMFMTASGGTVEGALRKDR